MTPLAMMEDQRGVSTPPSGVLAVPTSNLRQAANAMERYVPSGPFRRKKPSPDGLEIREGTLPNTLAVSPPSSGNPSGRQAGTAITRFQRVLAPFGGAHGGVQ